jgi:hypothetical protein
MGSSTTRRQFLHRGAAVSAALGVGATWAPRAIAASGSAAATVLAAHRRETYSALADTVLSGPSFRLPAGAADSALADFETAYAAWPAQARRRADAILDALGREFRGRGRGGREHVLRGSARSDHLAADALSLLAVAVAGDTQTVVTV